MEHVDVKFIAGDRPVYAHRAVLSCGSEYFAAMFRFRHVCGPRRLLTSVKVQGFGFDGATVVVKPPLCRRLWNALEFVLFNRPLFHASCKNGSLLGEQPLRYRRCTRCLNTAITSIAAQSHPQTSETIATTVLDTISVPIPLGVNREIASFGCLHHLRPKSWQLDETTDCGRKSRLS